MYSNGRCIHYNQCKNLCGKSIELKITAYGNKTLEVIVKYIKENRLYQKVILLVLIVLLNVLLIFEVLNIVYSIALFVIALLVVYNIASTVKQEKVLIVEHLGYQIEVCYVFGKSTQFIAWENVRAIVVNEVISKQRVIFIIALLTKDTAKAASAIVPLFTHTMPRLVCLQAIYQHTEHYHHHSS